MGARRDEQGQTLPLVTLVLVTLFVAAALGVDIGSLAVTNRRLQSVADLAAIDGARELTGSSCSDAPPPALISQYDRVAAAVQASAVRNGFQVGGTKTLTVELGYVTRDAVGVPTFNPFPNACTAPSVPDSVRVRAGDRTGFSFASVIRQNGRTSTRAGVGTLEGRGAFRLGGSVASIDTRRSALLNPILSQMVCDPPATCSLNLAAASYDGLLHSELTFGQLAKQLKLNGVLSLGTTSELFAANLTLDQIFQAAIDVLGSSSTAFVALNGLTAAITATSTIKLAKLVSAGLANGNDAADVGINLFDLVTGAAAIANGTNFVDIPSSAVSIPGVASITARASLIEAPITIGDRPGATAPTKQLSLTVTPNLNLTGQGLSTLTGVSVTGALPITISGGVATGTLSAVRCGAAKGIDTTIAVNAANLAASGTLNVSLLSSANSGVLGPLVGGVVNLLLGGTTTGTIAVNGTRVTTDTGTYNVPFASPSEFPSGSTPGVVKHVGNTTIGLDDLTYGNATLNLLIPTLLGGTAAATMAIDATALSALLAPVMAQIDTLLVQPLLDVLGLDLGGADVWAKYLRCGVPGLAG